MQKVVKDNIIYVEKPKMSMVPLILSAASLLFVALGAASLFYFQQPLQESQETRSAASVAGGQVILTSQLTSSAVYTSGAPSTIELKYNSQGVQLTGIQIVTKLTANAETPTIEIPNGDLQAIFQEVEQLSDGYLVSVIVTPKVLGQSFASTSPTTFAKLSVPLRGPGTMSFVYDKDNSFATVANTNPPKDELRTPEDVTFTIIAGSSPSPSPSPSVSPTPSPSPTPTPTPNPTGDDFWLRSDQVYLKFFTNDSARTEVALADLKPYETYRIRVQYGVQNAKKSSTTDTSPVQTAFVVNGQGSSYVTDDLPYSLIANHADGASDSIETVFTTVPDNTLRMTTDSRSAYAESNESNNVLLVTFNADNGVGGASNLSSCNQYCADSTECQSGYTCFFNQCRRPDNPDSSTCSAPSSTIASNVVQSCNKECSSNRDCAVNLRCYQGACRLATNPSSLSCSAATAGVISKGSQTGLAGEKGEVKVVPTGSPTASASVRPSSSPLSSVSPTASPSLLDQRPETNPSQSFLSKFFADMQARGISLPVIAVAVGLVLFILALIFAVLGRTGNRPPTVIQARREPPKTAYEDDLQKKINALKTQASESSAAPSVTTSPSSVPSSTSPTPTPPSPSSPTSSMMDRLRERKVLENMPGTEQSAQTPPPSSSSTAQSEPSKEPPETPPTV